MCDSRTHGGVFSVPQTGRHAAPRTRRGSPRRTLIATSAVCDFEFVSERGVAIALSANTFYRAESAQARDLECVLARVESKRLGRCLSVLDGACASGARGSRLAALGILSRLTCVDVSSDVRDALEYNLSSHVRQNGLECVEFVYDDVQRVFARKWLDAEFFDIVDVDGFGSANFADGALRVVRHGGYFYATCTDGRALCGQNPERCATSFANSVVAPSRPSVNETAIRVFIADVVRRADALKLQATPVFSLFHPHGPVFRVMFRVDKRGDRRGYDAFDADSRRVGFAGYCDACGSTETVRRPLVTLYGHAKLADDEPRGESLRCALCASSDGEAAAASARRSSQLAISGPMWLGPLHDLDTVRSMRAEALNLGWLHSDEQRVRGQLPLQDLFEIFEGEADASLSSHYYRTDELGRKGRARRVPPRDALLEALRSEGHRAVRSSFDRRGFKTDASVDTVVTCADSLCRILDETRKRS